VRGGRNIVERGAKAGRAASGATPVSSTFTGIRTCPACGRPWNPLQEQTPLQLSGANGGECLRMDCCADATVKEMPSHRSQCGGFAVNQNSNPQTSHAHTRCRSLLFILLTINDCSNGPALDSSLPALRLPDLAQRTDASCIAHRRYHQLEALYQRGQPSPLRSLPGGWERREGYRGQWWMFLQHKILESL
jgi:hypothetical protein